MKKSFKKSLIILLILIILIGVGITYYMIKEKPTEYQSNMNIVLSLEDEIEDNTVWCGTFNLIWNDLKNDLAKQDIVFNPQLKVVENLNKGTFTTKELDEASYYKVYGTPTLELKREIEKAIKEKFNETSDILDDFDWGSHSDKDYFLYAMLKKTFEFPKKFTELNDGTFNGVENVKYFGINNKTNDKVREQVKALYYSNEDDFAIKLLTKTNDEVIIVKGNNDKTFKDIYDNTIEKSKSYGGRTSFNDADTLRIPNITFKLKKSFPDIEKKEFLFANGDIYMIDQTLQTIEFELDKKGGKVKSEAGMMVKELAMLEERNFNVNSTFTIFLIEKDKNLPYFAAKISDINNVQRIK